MSDEEKFLDRPLEVVQDDMFVLDAVKGLEALAGMVASAVSVRYPRFKEVEPTPEEVGDLDDGEHMQEEIDKLHFFIDETKRFAKGARQQLEQRIFGGRH